MRFHGLYAVQLLDVSCGGACVQSDRTFQFGSGRLIAKASTARFAAAPHFASLASLEGTAQIACGVRLVWSRLVKTGRGQFGDVCPTFWHGLEVDGESSEQWIGFWANNLRSWKEQQPIQPGVGDCESV